MAGFAARVPRRSREYPKSPDSPKSRGSLSVLVSESPCVSVSHVSNGQAVDGELQKDLQQLAARNARTHAGDMAAKKRFELARDVKALEKRIRCKLSNAELIQVFSEWYRISQPFPSAAGTRDDHLAAFPAQLQKIRVPTGEGMITDALQYVSKLAEADLPVIPGYGNALEPRRIAALHRELARRSQKKDKRYFLSYRDAAKVSDRLSHQEAHTITLALASVGVIDIVNKGSVGLNSGKAAEFRYLLSESDNPAKDEDDDNAFVL